MDQSRRDALKKLGLATGVGAAATTEWAKPVVNALVVPAHAQTTSGSGSGTPLSGSSTIEYKSGPKILQLALTASDFTSVGASSSSTVVLYGSTMSSYIDSTSSFDGRHYFYLAGVNTAPFANGITGSATIDGSNFTATTSVA